MRKLKSKHLKSNCYTWWSKLHVVYAALSWMNLRACKKGNVISIRPPGVNICSLRLHNQHTSLLVFSLFTVKHRRRSTAPACLLSYWHICTVVCSCRRVIRDATRSRVKCRLYSSGQQDVRGRQVRGGEDRSWHGYHTRLRFILRSDSKTVMWSSEWNFYSAEFSNETFFSLS